MIEVEIEDQAWTEALPDAEAVVTRAADAALAHLDDWKASHVAVLLTSDDEVRALNARHRGKDKPTNVLSFPAPASARPHIGDLALACGVCTAEAEAQHKTLEHHLAHLVVHGVLHLVGYDHQADADAEVMEDMERAVLAGFGVPDPYAQDKADAQP